MRYVCWKSEAAIHSRVSFSVPHDGVLKIALCSSLPCVSLATGRENGDHAGHPATQTAKPISFGIYQERRMLGRREKSF